MAGSKQNLRLFAVALPRFEQGLNFWWLESVLIVLVFQFFMLRRDPIGSYHALHLARPLADHVTQPWKPRRCGANSVEKLRFWNLKFEKRNVFGWKVLDSCEAKKKKTKQKMSLAEALDRQKKEAEVDGLETLDALGNIWRFPRRKW